MSIVERTPIISQLNDIIHKRTVSTYNLPSNKSLYIGLGLGAGTLILTAYTISKLNKALEHRLDEAETVVLKTSHGLLVGASILAVLAGTTGIVLKQKYGQ